MFWSLVSLAACSVTVGEEGREAPPGMHLKCAQTLTSPHSPYHSLPTINEHSNVAVPKCRTSLALNNGAPCPASEPVESTSASEAKVQRSVSFGSERVKPKFASLGVRQGGDPPPPPSSSPPSTPPAVIDFLLPVLKVENCDSDAMQHR